MWAFQARNEATAHSLNDGRQVQTNTNHTTSQKTDWSALKQTRQLAVLPLKILRCHSLRYHVQRGRAAQLKLTHQQITPRQQN